MNEERRALGAQFKRARCQRGLSQQDVMRITGLSQPCISRIEAGKDNVALDTLVAFARALDLPLWRVLMPERADA